MDKNKYKIVIKGGYGLTNFGDDALLYTLATKLSPYFKSGELAFACYKNKYNESLVSGFKIEDIELVENIDTKFLVYGGGTQFYSFKPPRHLFRQFLSKCKRLLMKSSIYDQAFHKRHNGYQYLGTLGVGVGPFLNDSKKTAENATKTMFQEMDFVSIRDTFSYAKCQEWHIEKIVEDADICYQMEDQNFTFSKSNSKIDKIGIIVRDWNHTEEGKSYYNEIYPLVEQLEKKGYKVTLILFATGSDKYWNQEKIRFKHILEWDPLIMNIDYFINQLNEFDLFITSRYHGAIFASLLSKPFICIVVEQKLELISDLYKGGSEKWKYPFDFNDCLIKVDNINNNYANYTEAIRLQTTKQKERAEGMFNRFIKFCYEKNIL